MMIAGNYVTAMICAALTCGGALPALGQEAVITLPATSPFPESLTASAQGVLYTGSLTNGGILRAFPESTEAEIWIQPGAFDTRSIFGVLADDGRGLLWVCSNDASGMGISGPNTVAGSFVKSFDLASGEGRDSVPLPSQPAVCNDLALGPDGSIYVTNTAQPQILRLTPGADKMKVWAEDSRLSGGLDGLAFGVDGALYVNTFMSGELFRVEAGSDRAGDITKIETPRALTFPDGLKAHGDDFLMVEGTGSLLRVSVLDGKATLSTIADFSGPSGLAVSGDKIWVSEGRILDLMNPADKGDVTPGFYLRAVPID